MKKNLIAFIVCIVAFYSLKSQTNPALLTNLHIDGDLKIGYTIGWNVANNEVAYKFEIQKSVNGIVYTTIAAIEASEKIGTETYAWNMESSEQLKTMYRIKMISRGQNIYYSNIITLTAKSLSNNKIDLLGNPVKDKLVLRFNEYQAGTLEIRIFDLAGRIIDDRKIDKIKKNEVVNILLDTRMTNGMYVVEINNGSERITNKFIKQ